MRLACPSSAAFGASKAARARAAAFAAGASPCFSTISSRTFRTAGVGVPESASTIGDRRSSRFLSVRPKTLNGISARALLRRTLTSSGSSVRSWLASSARRAPASPSPLFLLRPCSTTTRRAVALPKRASAETPRSRSGCSSASSNGASPFLTSIDSSPWTRETRAASARSCLIAASPATASLTRGGGSDGSANGTRASRSASGASSAARGVFRRRYRRFRLKCQSWSGGPAAASSRRRSSAVARASGPWISSSESRRRRRSRFSSTRSSLMSDATERPGKNDRMRARGCWFRASSPRLRTRSRSTASCAFRRAESERERRDLVLDDELLGDVEHPRRARQGALIELLDGGRDHLVETLADLLLVLRQRDDAPDRLRRGRARGGERLLDGLRRQRQRPGRDRTAERADDLAGGTSTPAARRRSSAAPSSPSERDAIAATARIWATSASRGDWMSAPYGTAPAAPGAVPPPPETAAAAPGAPAAPAGGRQRVERSEALEEHREMAKVRDRRGRKGNRALAGACLRGRGPVTFVPCRCSISTGAARTLSAWPSRPRFWRRISRSAGGQNASRLDARSSMYRRSDSRGTSSYWPIAWIFSTA